MSRILLACVILLTLLITATGCLQAPALNPTPAPVPPAQPAVSETLPPAVAFTTGIQKYLNFDVSRSDSSVDVTYNGGPDASSLSAITIRITNRDGTQSDPRTIQNPAIGSPYIFTYRGLANPSTVNIIGTFSDGTQQTVLMHYF
jgi:hypothetical protein